MHVIAVHIVWKDMLRLISDTQKIVIGLLPLSEPLCSVVLLKYIIVITRPIYIYIMMITPKIHSVPDFCVRKCYRKSNDKPQLTFFKIIIGVLNFMKF